MTTADKINDQLDVALCQKTALVNGRTTVYASRKVNCLAKLGLLRIACQSVVKDAVIVWQGKEYAV